MTRAAFALPALLLLAACQIGSRGLPRADLLATDDAPPPPATGVVAAILGEPARFEGLTLTPVMVSEDSRCPVGAQCITAGTLRVSTAITTAAGSDIRVMTLGAPMPVEGRSATLVGLCPLPNVQRQVIPPRPTALYAVTAPGEAIPTDVACPEPGPTGRPFKLLPRF